ncbi:hypothetical protein M378DRAFT_71426 [Amanita muscaria Koide BX008]|uniref:Uncharacterized protein n=1 Tax=Amanita muscaria (strain Koide BX008) TaxID=946122 RepID=A0A0C2TN19_AMAMK|nr:hypothetical protein M378DRAFT_71426 [Amanita muscaria Koide BX008]
MECDNIHSCRTLPSLLSSCASVVFLCTWATLHLDVPDEPDEPFHKGLRRRFGWTIGALVAPELILFVAMCEWASSCNHLSGMIEKYPKCGWTETHALFADMGGFCLIKPDGSRKSLRKGDFFQLVMKGTIDVPNISLKEIQDKSKSDHVAKIIAVIQTLWFLLQTLNRAVQRLPVTELELSTVAYVASYLLLSWGWWNKPLDVRIPVDIQPREHKDASAQGNSATGESEHLLKKDDGPVKETGVTPDTESQSLRRHLSIRVRAGAYLADGNRSIWKSFIFFILCFVAGGLFGAIHCIAWNWSKDSVSGWRFSAAFVTVYPGVAFFLLDVINSDSGPETVFVYGISKYLVILYGTARISLFVQTFVALRSLSYEAYVTPSWTVYIPHIG